MGRRRSSSGMPKGRRPTLHDGQQRRSFYCSSQRTGRRRKWMRPSHHLLEAGGLLLLFLRSLSLVLRVLLLLRLLPLNGEAQKQAAYGGKLESSLSLPRPVLHALVPSRRCATSLVASCA